MARNKTNPSANINVGSKTKEQLRKEGERAIKEAKKRAKDLEVQRLVAQYVANSMDTIPMQALLSTARKVVKRRHANR